MPFKVGINVHTTEVEMPTGTELAVSEIHKVWGVFNKGKSYGQISSEIHRSKRAVGECHQT